MDTIQLTVFLTPEEAGALRDDLAELLTRHARLDRLTDLSRRPEGSYPFEVVAFTHVLNLPGTIPTGATVARKCHRATLAKRLGMSGGEDLVDGGRGGRAGEPGFRRRRPVRA
jgi:hypothetical protein